MTTVLIILMCVCSGFLGFHIGTEDCKEFKASHQVVVLEEKVHELKTRLEELAPPAPDDTVHV